MDDDTGLRLWQVEVQIPRGSSPARPNIYVRRHMVNVAAFDIHAAIIGALDELEDRYDGSPDGNFDRNIAWVVSANHKGAVNRVMT